MIVVQNPKYSVIVPVFNSEGTLEELFSRTKSVFEKLNESFEFVFVDDSSKDMSWEVLNKLKQNFPEHIRIRDRLLFY